MRRFILIIATLVVYAGCRTADPPLQNPSPPPDVPTQPYPPNPRAPGTAPPLVDTEQRAALPPPEPVPPKGEVVGGEVTTEPSEPSEQQQEQPREQEGERQHHGETVYPDGTVVDPIQDEDQ